MERILAFIQLRKSAVISTIDQHFVHTIEVLLTIIERFVRFNFFKHQANSAARLYRNALLQYRNVAVARFIRHTDITLAWFATLTKISKQRFWHAEH